jgi:hypothetical protein
MIVFGLGFLPLAFMPTHLALGPKAAFPAYVRAVPPWAGICYATPRRHGLACLFIHSFLDLGIPCRLCPPEF